MEITNQDLNCFLDWKTKTGDLKENISQLESREMEVVMVYYSIMQKACMQFAGFVAVSSMMAGLFREFKHFLVLGIVVTYILYIIYPLHFESKKINGLICSSRELIAERKRLYRSCISLISEYSKMCDVASSFKDMEDVLFKEIGDAVMKKIKNFIKEDTELVYQTKYYQKNLLLIGVLGIIYAIAFISAFCVYFQDAPRVMFQSIKNESVVLPTTVVVKRLLLGNIQQ